MSAQETATPAARIEGALLEIMGAEIEPAPGTAAAARDAEFARRIIEEKRPLEAWKLYEEYKAQSPSADALHSVVVGAIAEALAAALTRVMDAPGPAEIAALLAQEIALREAPERTA